ncbi:hypothetical protein L7F22_006394 [Adiantum nelumboides]|nr:hypothetical protein [Adiantum nelumboides]
MENALDKLDDLEYELEKAYEWLDDRKRDKRKSCSSRKKVCMLQKACERLRDAYEDEFEEESSDEDDDGWVCMESLVHQVGIPKMEEKETKKEAGQKSLEGPLDNLILPLECAHGVEEEYPLLKIIPILSNERMEIGIRREDLKIQESQKGTPHNLILTPTTIDAIDVSCLYEEDFSKEHAILFHKAHEMLIYPLISYGVLFEAILYEYATGLDFKDVISAIALGKKEEPFTLQDGYLLHGNSLCITRSLREKVMFESHAPPYAGHRGIQTTMKAIQTYFYWPTMKGDIQDYVSKCVVCQKTKYDRGKQRRLLQPLPIPDSPWESISMDFIFGFPKSIHGNTGIWTIVDRFRKQAHFIPIKKTIKAHQMATFFISQIFKYHGLPTSIVSDRNPRMTNNFWKGLFENLGTRLNFSSAYHLQMDGQSEIPNLTILDLLKAYVTEVDQCSQWEKYLPLLEYAYNNTVHTSTGKAPFEVIEGRPKVPLLLKVHGKIFAADEYSRDLKESFQKIKEAISIAQQKQEVAANKHQRALAFKEND